MPFGQPYVLDESGQIFGNALGNAGSAIANALLRNKDLARQRTMFAIQNPGFHLLRPGEQAPADDQTLNVQGSPQVQSTPTAFQKNINDALSVGMTPQAQQPASVTRASAPLVRGQGYYYDPNEARAILMPRMMMSGLGQYYDKMYGAMGTAAGNPLLGDVQRSQVAKNLGQANEANRAANAPHLGDAAYAPAMGAVAQAQEQGRLPGETQLATTNSNLAEGRERRLLGLRINEEYLRPTVGIAAANIFNKQNDDLVQGVKNYAQAKTALAQARSGNPAALKSALISFASVADPKAQLRQGVMHEVMQVDPSFSGTWEQAIDRLTSGQVPPRILNDMDQMLDQVHGTNRALFDQRRQSFLKQNPTSQNFVPTTESTFDVPGVTQSDTGAGPAPTAPRRRGGTAVNPYSGGE